MAGNEAAKPRREKSYDDEPVSSVHRCDSFRIADAKLYAKYATFLRSDEKKLKEYRVFYVPLPSK